MTGAATIGVSPASGKVVYSPRCVAKAGFHKVIHSRVGNICIRRIAIRVRSPAGLLAAAHAGRGYCMREHQKWAKNHKEVLLFTVVAGRWCGDRHPHWVHIVV